MLQVKKKAKTGAAESDDSVSAGAFNIPDISQFDAMMEKKKTEQKAAATKEEKQQSKKSCCGCCW